MNKTRKKLAITFAIVCCAIAGLAWHLYTSVPLVAFNAVNQGVNQQLQMSTSPLTEAQADRVVSVLQRYSQPYHRKNRTTILITPQLSMDQELVWNYTSKAGIE